MTVTDSPTTPAYASPADTTAHGAYSFNRAEGLPVYRFDGRLGSSEHPAEAGRYHLYAGWFCPWAQRSTLTVELAGIGDAVSVSYVHGERDGRGWAFREPTGPDPVNGFELLRQAYDATQPGFDGHVSVPTLWDRRTGQVVTNTYGHLDIDLATKLAPYAVDGIELYPADLADAIDELDAWIGPAVNHGVAAAGGSGADADEARDRFNRALGELDVRLSDRTYLLGDRLTLADVRLWVTLARFDASNNATGTIGPRLDSYPQLWDWARHLYQQPAFTRTTDFGAFSVPGAPQLDWSAPTTRAGA